METIKIRPHHLLCLQFYVGRGYNENFVNNLNDIISNLNSNNYEIILVDGNDDICKCCPNLINNVCKDINKVKEYDKNILNLSHLDYKQYKYDKVKDIIKRNIIDANINLNIICKNCCWLTICNKIKKEKTNGY